MSSFVLFSILRNLFYLILVSVLAPVVFNALIVGAEITFLAPEGFLWPAFLATALSVGAGELLVCVVLGIPLLLLIRRMKLDERFFSL